MDLIPVTTLTDEVMKSLRTEYLTEKPFPHMAGLIYCLTKYYDDLTDPIAPTDEELLLFSVGFGLERVLLSGHERPESAFCEGIGFSVDFNSIEGIPAELKTTRMSVNTVASKGLPDGWIKQTKGYCHCRGVKSYLLTVLFLMGSYKPPFPIIKSFRLDFTEEEITENWDWLLERKAAIESFLADGIRPEPDSTNEPWECTNCRYKLRCDVVRAGGTL